MQIVIQVKLRKVLILTCHAGLKSDVLVEELEKKSEYFVIIYIIYIFNLDFINIEGNSDWVGLIVNDSQ